MMIAANWDQWLASGAWFDEGMTVMPTPPRALEEVFWLASESDVDAHRLIRLVSKDPAIAVRVLRLANAAAFAPAREITSIEHAVVRMGTQAVRNTVLAACFAAWADSFRTYGPRAVQQVQHALGTACLARHVARAAGEDPDEAFAQGLLHDIGKLFLVRLATDFEKRTGERPSGPQVDAAVATHHARVGAEALQCWGVPEALRGPVRWHHEPLSATITPRACAVIYVANGLSHRYGFGCEPDRERDLLADEVVCALGIDSTALADLDRDAPALMEAARQLVM